MLKILKTITTISLSLSLLSPIQGTTNTVNNTSIPSIQREAIEAVKEYSTCYTQELKTNEELQVYATRFLKDNYNMDLDIPVTFKSIEGNNILGQFIYYKDTNKPIEITINDIMLTDNNYCSHDIERTLIHELVHYYLNSTNQDFKDNQETFEQENFEKGGRSNTGAKANYLNSRIMSNCCD